MKIREGIRAFIGAVASPANRVLVAFIIPGHLSMDLQGGL